jgi:hypothetical protein
VIVPGSVSHLSVGRTSRLEVVDALSARLFAKISNFSKLYFFTFNSLNWLQFPVQQFQQCRLANPVWANNGYPRLHVNTEIHAFEKFLIAIAKYNIWLYFADLNLIKL